MKYITYKYVLPDVMDKTGVRNLSAQCLLLAVQDVKAIIRRGEDATGLRVSELENFLREDVCSAMCDLSDIPYNAYVKKMNELLEEARLNEIRREYKAKRFT